MSALPNLELWATVKAGRANTIAIYCKRHAWQVRDELTKHSVREIFARAGVRLFRVRNRILLDALHADERAGETGCWACSTEARGGARLSMLDATLSELELAREGASA